MTISRIKIRMSKRRNNKNNSSPPFVYDEIQKVEIDERLSGNNTPPPANREETMSEIFNLTNNKTFSNDPAPLKVKDAWGFKTKK